MDKHAEHFIETFVKELEEENVAIFAGAGLSVGAGCVDWRKLLQPIAHELGLDIDKEHDLISIAQYHLNEKQNRSGLNRALIEQLSPGHVPTESHRILARLPIKTYWTTNYDKLIEDSLKGAGKIPDVKFTIDHLKLTRPKRDAIVYKMHGDIDHPDGAVLTKDDYERYE
jgi:NAD-dependent SIR2 family protein deacetylase